MAYFLDADASLLIRPRRAGDDIHRVQRVDIVLELTQLRGDATLLMVDVLLELSLEAVRNVLRLAERHRQFGPDLEGFVQVMIGPVAIFWEHFGAHGEHDREDVKDFGAVLRGGDLPAWIVNFSQS